MNIHLFILLLVLLVSSSEALSVLAPRSPKGGHGGGGHGSSGGHGSGGHSGSGGGGKGAHTGRGGSGDTGHASIKSPSRSRSMNYFSGGGGKRFTIPSGNAFAGRQMGGGTRNQVLGTPRYASGYPYYVNNPQTRGVYGNPFPFGYWPIYWHGYGYSDEYGYNTSVAAQRPGGNLSMVNLAPGPGSNWNVSAPITGNNTYWMVGDYQTVQTVLSLLVDPQGSHTYACGVKNNTILPFNSSSPALPFHVQNVMQWYRSSSFALAYTGYNNTYATAPLNETTTLDNSSPFPADQVNSPFLRCMNTTMLASIAILDGDPEGLDAGEIVGIVVGSLVGAILVGIAVLYIVTRRKQWTEYHKLDEPKH